MEYPLNRIFSAISFKKTFQGKKKSPIFVDLNKHFKNKRYHLAGVYCDTIIRNQLFDRWLIKQVCVSKDLWCIDYFASDVVFLWLMLETTIRNCIYLGINDAGNFSNSYVSLCFGSIMNYAFNSNNVP